MKACIMCGKEVHADDGYVTDGKIFVCRKCAEINSLRTITVRISNTCAESNIHYVWEAPVEAESSLVNQTDSPHVELDKSVLDGSSIHKAEIFSDIENLSEEDFLSKYCDDPYALDAWYDNHVYQTDEV